MSERNNFYKNIANGLRPRIQRLFKNEAGKGISVSWFYTKYLKHVSADKIHTYKLFGYPTFFSDGPGFLHGLHEVFMERIYKQELPANAFIIDCGAHIGLSVIFLKSICPDARIIAFEPDDKNYLLLTKNVSSHKLNNVETRQEAVWIEDTDLQFIQEGNMGSRIGLSSADSKTVKAIRLKNFLNQKIDFLKLDIEGAEYCVIKDIAENLHQVDNLFIEYHGMFSQNNELLEILEIVRKAGYQFYIKEAAISYDEPFFRKQRRADYDVQLNIFCFRA